jgi:hypothetical protein
LRATIHDTDDESLICLVTGIDRVIAGNLAMARLAQRYHAPGADLVVVSEAPPPSSPIGAYPLTSWWWEEVFDSVCGD